jgi:hypothetical protein
MAPLGRQEANSLAGEDIIFHNDKSKVSAVEGMPSPTTKLVAPLFNLVRVHALISFFSKNVPTGR